MKQIKVTTLMLLLVLSSILASTVNIKCGIGIGSLTTFSTELYYGNKTYEAWDLFRNKQCFGFSIYYTKNDIINLGISYSRIKEILNNSIFTSTDTLFGALTIDKLGLSILIGKTILLKYHPYLICEPGYYYVQDKTYLRHGNIFDKDFKTTYSGNNFYGIGIGGGFDYYFMKYIGLTSSLRYDFAIVYDHRYIWINYPSIQFGLLFSY
jgi:hypothetical protein